MRRLIVGASAAVAGIILVVALVVVFPRLPKTFAAYQYFFTTVWTPDPYNAYMVTTTTYDYGATGARLMNNQPNSGEMAVTVPNVGIGGPTNPAHYIMYLGANYAGNYCCAYLTDYSLTVDITGSALSVTVNSSVGAYLLGSTTISNHDNMVVRAVQRNDGVIVVWVDNSLVLVCGNPIGNPGAYPGVGWTNYASPMPMSLGALDTIAPTAIPAANIGVSAFATHVDLQWPAAVDDANGTGVALYQVLRNGQLMTTTTTAGGSFSDTTVTPNTAYTYTVNAFDYHLNYGSTTINVTTPHVPTNPPFPSSVPDGRRVGVRTTGAYWGAGSEQIDVLSGNVNYTLPLLNALQRGGASVGFGLSYNSQNWRKDSGGTWQFGEDTGYGYGWKLMAGSITPVWSNPYTASYYLFTDASGAQYRLDQNTGNIWTSKESMYASFDANANVLFFRDGTHWTFGCTSGPSEPDSGVMYPTLMEDTNGNVISVSYYPSVGSTWYFSSSRISQIYDVRAVNNGSGNFYTYLFNYTTFSGDSIPHLTSITNQIGTSDAYTFSYTGSALASPISPFTSFGNTRLLSSVTTQGINTSNQFVYGSNNSGELTKAILPYGGYLSWDYANVAYSSGVTYREVAHRYLSKDGSSNTTTYQFSHEATPGANIRQYTILDDPSGVGEKYWAFGQSGVAMGLLSTYQGRSRPGPVTLQESDLTWAQDAAGNSYISSALQKMDPGQTYEADKKTDETVDVHGNVTQLKQYNFGSLSTPVRTYNYTYLNSSSYTSRYIFNRMTQATVTANSTTTTLVTNTYDQGNPTGTNGVPDDWDSNYWNVTNRGSLTTSTTVDGSKTMSYDLLGNPINITANAVSMSVTTSGSTHFAVPTALTAGSLTETFNWTAALAQSSTTGPNGDTGSTSYDSYGRPTGGTSPFGASSTVTYSGAPYSLNSPAVVTATINGRWTRNTMDGLGRTIKAEAGDAGGTKSVAESVYGSCGCSPTGKLMQQAVPHAPGATPVYTTSTYDGIGRTLTSVAPDGASTTTYLYKGNTVKVTDPTGKWKIFTTDAMGHLTQVEEPNPAGGADYFTNYTYDVLNNLTQVSMPRPSGTQTRSFVFNGRKLTSATNPENGTVSYTYNSYNKVATKTDAKGQQIVYTYDTLARLAKVQRYPTPGNEDTCQQENYSYNTNPYDGSFSQYASGRLTAVQYKGGYNDGSGSGNCNTTFTEMYSYNQAGGTVAKRLRVTRTQNSTTSNADLEGDYTYDNEGRITAVQYPSSTQSSVVTAPSFNPPAGTYASGPTVTITSGTSGASIRYTTDGSTPTSTTGTLYSSPITVSSTTTVKAIAYKAGMTNSSVTSATYTIGGGGATWYNASWSNRKAITIDHTKVSGSSALTNFPILFSATDANLKTVANGGNVGKSDGTDILFTAADGTTKLNHELESYTATTGTTIAWVKVPSVSNTTDTVIYVYYGNASAADQQNKTAVWDSNYKGVWHLPNGSALTANDSTSNANNGTNGGATAATGQIGGGASFANANSQYVGVPDSTSLEIPGSWTVSVWVNLASLPSSADYFSALVKGGATNYGIGIDNGAINQDLGWITWFNDSNSNTSSAKYVVTPTTGTWYYLTAVWDDPNHLHTLYLNGSSVATNDPGAGFHAGIDMTDLAFGTDPCCSAGYVDGKLDEARVSATIRSAGWIGTEYSNQSSPSTFMSTGSQQSSGSSSQVATPTFSPGAGSYTSAQLVTINTTTAGASIRYTTNGTTPTSTTGTLYSGAITVSSTTTVKAIAYKSGMTDSAVASAAYTISAGGLTTIAGPHLGTTYDTMGRPSTLTDLATSAAIISGTTYGAANQFLTMTGQVNETRTYNSMLQLTSLSSSNTSGGAVNITYAYSATQNNGKITSQTDSISGEQVVYTYDALNRLATAQATSNSWGQSYAYDGFGNLTDQNVTAGSAPALHVVYNAATNRQTGDCADSNGNLGSAPACSGTATNYDVENRMVSPSTANQWQYSYAPGNKRVWRGVWTSGSLTTDEVTFWGVDGHKVGTWQLSWYTGSQLYGTMTGCNYYFGGKLIKNASGYIAADQFGSVGKYYPYGQERPSATANGTEKFTGYFRDAETGLDYADQRYESPGSGRFTTPDPFGGSAGPNDPGSWNRYAYVGGDPVNRADPLGLAACGPNWVSDASLSGPCGGSGTGQWGGYFGGDLAAIVANAVQKAISDVCAAYAAAYASSGSRPSICGGPPTTPPPSSTAPCTITFESRGLDVPGGGVAALHGYLDFTSADGLNSVIEGYTPEDSGLLKAQDVPSPGLSANNPAADQKTGSISGAWVCGARGILDEAVGRINAAHLSYNTPGIIGPNSTSALHYLVDSIQGIVNYYLPIYSGTTNWYSVPYSMQTFGWYKSLPGLN